MGSRLKPVCAVFLLLQILDSCRGNLVGVCYGRDADDLPTPDKVAQLVQRHNIKYLRIYDSDSPVLKAFANTGIELMVGVHNSDLASFQSQSNVDSWLHNRILPHYPATKITHITVGVEVTDSSGNTASLAVPAMKNVVTALKKVDLHNRIKVSTPLSFNIMSQSFPPSAGAFSSSYAYFLKPFLEFLDENQSPFMINLYPFYASGDSSLDYLLFQSSSEVIDPNTGLHYTNMFDAQIDAVYFALDNQYMFDARLDAVHFELLDRNYRVPRIIVSETGWPTKGSPKEKGAGHHNAETYNNNLISHVMDDSGPTAMPEEGCYSSQCQTYETNLIRHVLDGSGTPAMRGQELDVYIFSLFNENLKPGPESERNWGLFYPNMTSVYNVDFSGKNTNSNRRSWCIASSQASQSSLQNALDWACGPGHADCSAIQPGQQCFEPDNLVSHASFAFNNYYQKNGATAEACSFGGNGIVVDKDPCNGNCNYPCINSNKGTWCIASRQASQSSLQNALDWACGPGNADCSAIQPGRPCFEPDNLVSHASYAFNNYYQKNGAAEHACSFGGNGIKVAKDPSYGNCVYRWLTKLQQVIRMVASTCSSIRTVDVWAWIASFILMALSSFFL